MQECRHFCYFTNSAGSNLSKPMIVEIIPSRNTGKFAQMPPPNFWVRKKNRTLPWIHHLGSYSILENHELYRIIGLYLKNSIYNLNEIQYNKIILCKVCYEGWNRMSFYMTRKLKHSILIRSDLKCFEPQSFTLKFINGKWWQQKQTK